MLRGADLSSRTGIGIFGANPKFIEELAAGRLDEVYHTLPVSIGIMGIIIAHELGHRVSMCSIACRFVLQRSPRRGYLELDRKLTRAL